MQVTKIYKGFGFGLCIFFSLSLLAQERKIEIPLSSNKIESVHIDNRGLLWIGTEEGLNVYNRETVNSFYSNIVDSTSVLNSEIFRVQYLAGDTVVAFSKNGLNVFNPYGFNFSRIITKSTPVSLIKDLSNNDYWVTTQNNGILHFSHSLKSLKPLEYDPLNPLSISSAKFNSNQRDIVNTSSSQFILIGTINGFNLFDRAQKTVRRFFKKTGSYLLSNEINDIESLNATNLFLVATSTGLNIFDTKNSQFTKDILFQNQKVVDVTKVDNQTFLLLTETSLCKLSLLPNGGFGAIQVLNSNKSFADARFCFGKKEIFIWSPNQSSFIQYNKNIGTINELSIKNNITAFAIDEKSDDLVIGTLNGVFAISNFKQFINEVPSNIVSSQVLYYKALDESNSIIISGSEISFVKNNAQVTKKINLPFLVGKNSSNKISFEINGSKLYIATSELYEIDLSNGTITQIPILTKSATVGVSNISNLKIIGTDLYISLPEGITVFNTISKSITRYQYDPLINKNIPKGFEDIEQINDQLWVSNSETGLYLFNKNLNSFVRRFDFVLNDFTTLASGSPTRLFYIKGTDYLLIASKGDGLFRYNLKTKLFNNYSSKDGLLSNNVIDLMQSNNNIWVVTTNGINYFDNPEKIVFKNIDSEDGLSIVSYLNEGLHHQDSSIIITGTQKIQLFKFKDIYLDNRPFRVEILNANSINKNNEYQNIGFSDFTINMNSDAVSLALNLFTSTSYKTKKVKFFYKIAGVTSGFISNEEDNKILLQSLRYYRVNEVEIYAINSSGKKSENILKLNIYKAAPWWARIESFIIYVLLLVSLIFFVFKIREKQNNERQEGKRKAKEIEEAKNLQMSLLPKKTPVVEGLEITTYLKCASEVGGDYFDFLQSDTGTLYSICGDATGHGVTSGIMVAVTKAALNGIDLEDPSVMLQKLNKIVRRINFGTLRMSLSIAAVTKDSITISSAAMPPAYLYNAIDNKLEELLISNLPLGGMDKEQFTSVTRQFNKGDICVMLSDGLPELPNIKNELLDYPNVFKCINENAMKSAEEIKDALVTLSNDWSGGLMNPDDITLVVIKHK
jgi:serine phosphatase RsbU (regulator of sigma subunit)/ligand-binding sensor domain-containing protein